MPIEIEAPEQMGYENIRCNLTESSFADLQVKDLGINLDDILLCYADHIGKKELRALIAADHKGITSDQVLTTVGAASALFIVSTTLLKAGDRLLVMRPNYATNIETPRAIGAQIDFLDLKFEEGFRLNVDELAARITPETKFVSLTNPHNPTGVMMTEKDLRAVIAVCEAKKVHLLFDETYREMTFGPMAPLAASLSPWAISVSSLSKTYGLPGIRLGWLITQDTKLFETFLAAKEQMYICNSILDEEVAYRFLKKKDQFLAPTLKRIREHFEIVKTWITQEKAMEWIEPAGGVVCFPRIRKDSGVNVHLFYKTLNEKYSTYVGPGHWFEQDRSFMRIGYGWPKTDELKEGLSNISLALREAKF